MTSFPANADSNNKYVFTGLPPENVATSASKETSNIFCIDGDNDSLSMHLSDVDSIYSITGDQFFDIDDNTAEDDKINCDRNQDDDFLSNSYQYHHSDHQYQQTNENQHCFQFQPTYHAQQTFQAPPNPAFDFEPLMFSTLQTAISRMPEHPKKKKSRALKKKISKRKHKVTTTEYQVESVQHAPLFVSESSPDATRYNKFQLALSLSKKSHDDLLAYDKRQGVKKGFSRTMSKTNSSRALVQSIVDDRRRMFGTQNFGWQQQNLGYQQRNFEYQQQNHFCTMGH
mmetsp:Transcript_26773/g.55313  ORF Transcript_26773/g.55313 Transcript_26773/m.55313 type:complete len:285 (+) Transcript_26773:133-987(+)|eukprot:CAMPEP_0171370178 /NCGR_PEP_ID=MMETSP0879-20121228/7862_1 /TAXON_ID=67004 /ORGANISM="Thalassiosira weissflogii, Strain CCMP1336" /LENGTH=284 /DNA_ID=CAMNT_0011878625 /DNA_START=104 /DNA_END=958 /DNA_ORIENTATION=+